MTNRDKVLDYIQRTGRTDTDSIAKATGISKPQIRRIQQELIKLGKLSRTAPGHFTPFDLSVHSTSPSERIKSYMEGCIARMQEQGYSAVLDMHKYPDGTIDAMMRVPYQRDVTPRHILLAMENASGINPTEVDYILVGMSIVEVGGRGSADRRYRGTENQYNSQFRPCTLSGISLAFLSARQTALNLTSKRQVMPDFFFTWIRHYPDGRYPKRNED